MAPRLVCGSETCCRIGSGNRDGDDASATVVTIGGDGNQAWLDEKEVVVTAWLQLVWDRNNITDLNEIDYH